MGYRSADSATGVAAGTYTDLMLSSTDPVTGVDFVARDGRRSSLRAGQSIVVAALDAGDVPSANAARAERTWRAQYADHFRALVQRGSADEAVHVAMAQAGLAEVGEQLAFVTGDDEMPLAEAAGGKPRRHHLATTLHGEGAAEREFSLPFDGARLRGQQVKDQVNQWIDDGVMEPSFAQVIDAVVEHPEWLECPGTLVALVGGGGQMSPLPSLLRWGARVAVVDVPNPSLWGALMTRFRESASTVTFPTVGNALLAKSAGLDVAADPAALRAWLAKLPGQMVLGNYTYADGADGVRLGAALDAVTAHVVGQRPETSLAYLGTPTDVYTVPQEVADASRMGFATAKWAGMRASVRLLSAGRALQPHYGHETTGPTLCDSTLPQQGPNYLLAKHIQRWRCSVHRAGGGLASYAVAPPALTRSVTSSPVMAAAYRGAKKFGVSVFNPATASSLMAARLVYDLHKGPSSSSTWESESFAAVHGGMWRSPYEPRTALPLAALIGKAMPS